MNKYPELLRVGSIALALAMVVVWQGFALAKDDVAQNSGAQHPSYACSIKVPEPEPRDLSSLAKVRADSALAAATAANPGATATKVELENENGCLVYSVQLNNGLDVKVDAGKGTVIHSQPAGSDDRESEHEGHESED